MLPARSSANTSDGDSSSNTKSAIIAGAVVGSLCVLGLVFMWCYLWRRRNLQLRGGVEDDRQRELDAMHAYQTENIRATTEFKWPARIGEASARLTQPQEAQEGPEKEVYVSSTTSFPKPGTPASVLRRPDYHISPKSFSSEIYRNHEQQQQQHDLKPKNSSVGIFQPELAELPPHKVSELYHQQPQELPVSTPTPIVAHELEGNRSPETPGERNRFSYQR